MIFKDAQEVINLLTPIINLYKKYDPKTNNPRYKYKIDDLPDFYPNYKTAIKYAHRIRIHSETGCFPETLFINRYPNQTDKEFEYMKSNYKQNTLPVFVDFVSTMTRPFSDGNWDIQYDDENEQEKDDFRHYVENEIEVVRSLKEYVKGLLPSLKTVDANGVIAIRPEKVFKIVDEETEEEVIDNSTLVSPQPYYYPIEQVLSDTKYDDDYFILESAEKSEVEYAGQKLKKGHVFEIHDENNIWIAKQVGKFTDYKFDVEIYFTHNAGRLMASRMKGIPQFVNGSYLWQSQFMYGCDLLDLALTNANYLQCTLANSMFPYRVMIGNKCEYKEQGDGGAFWACDGGKIFSSKTSTTIDCPSCHGSGLRDRVSPMGVMLLNPSDMNSDGDVKFSGKAMEYVSPETTASEFVLKKIESDLAKARDVVKIKPSRQAQGPDVTPGAKTATEELGDQKAQYAAVKMFNDQVFDLYDFLLFGIGYQRYGNNFKMPILIRPTSFDFNTETDYLEKITSAQEAKLSPSIIGNLIYKYLQTIYFNNQKAAAVFNLVYSTDMLFVLSQDDVIMKFNRGLCQPWQIILHDSADQLIDELVEEHKDAKFCDVNDCTKGFFALDFKEQKELLIKKAKEKAAEIQQVQPAAQSLLDRARQQALPPAA